MKLDAHVEVKPTQALAQLIEQELIGASGEMSVADLLNEQRRNGNANISPPETEA